VGGTGRGGREPDTRVAEREAGGCTEFGRAAGSGSGDETQLAHFVKERKQLLGIARRAERGAFGGLE